MERKIYISDGVLSLAEFADVVDDKDCYNCWLDEETQKGYNCKMTDTWEEYIDRPRRQYHFSATVIRCADNVPVGFIGADETDAGADLSIMLYPPFRNEGYGTVAFGLGVKYCFEVLRFKKLYAGCYENNFASRRMIEKCGFLRNPEGDLTGKHYLTGEKIIQYDFVKYNDSIGRKHDGT